jgi:hypothetical protein
MISSLMFILYNILSGLQYVKIYLFEYFVELI